MTASPTVYETIIPRDQAFSKTWSGNVLGLGDTPITIGNWSATISMDIYDTPTGIYDTFPKPGFLFEKGVCVHSASTGVDPKIHWAIFYSE